jgi:hypothetical protein
MLFPMSLNNSLDFRFIYDHFDTPITGLDCGNKCAAFNQTLAPFCCDTHHAVPSAYPEEWEFLKTNTDLWRKWHNPTKDCASHLDHEKPEGHILIECKGHQYCQRSFRSITCRSFPFFPYIDHDNQFIGLSYYWQYADRCWVISNLHKVTMEYRIAFITNYDLLFRHKSAEKDIYRYHSVVMRRVFGRKKMKIPILHRDGKTYQIVPKSCSLIPVDPICFPKYEPFKTVHNLPFPDEAE